jgi:hypothetical protein
VNITGDACQQILIWFWGRLACSLTFASDHRGVAQYPATPLHTQNSRHIWSFHDPIVLAINPSDEQDPCSSHIGPAHDIRPRWSKHDYMHIT